MLLLTRQLHTLVVSRYPCSMLKLVVSRAVVLTDYGRHSIVRDQARRKHGGTVYSKSGIITTTYYVLLISNIYCTNVRNTKLYLFSTISLRFFYVVECTYNHTYTFYGIILCSAILISSMSSRRLVSFMTSHENDGSGKPP